MRIMRKQWGIQKLSAKRSARFNALYKVQTHNAFQELEYKIIVIVGAVKNINSRLPPTNVNLMQ